MPALNLCRGAALNGLGEWQKALKHLEAYHDLLVIDTHVCREMGRALHGLGRFADAARFQRKALDISPKDADALRTLARQP